MSAFCLQRAFTSLSGVWVNSHKPRFEWYTSKINKSCNSAYRRFHFHTREHSLLIIVYRFFASHSHTAKRLRARHLHRFLYELIRDRLAVVFVVVLFRFDCSLTVSLSASKQKVFCECSGMHMIIVFAKHICCLCKLSMDMRMWVWVEECKESLHWLIELFSNYER